MRRTVQGASSLHALSGVFLGLIGPLALLGPMALIGPLAIIGPMTLIGPRLAGAIKLYCMVPTDGNCDGAWSPVPNLDSALVGYDLPTGNPLSSESIEDPGLRNPVFNLTWLDGDRYQLHPGITVREYRMCDEGFSTELATNMATYTQIAALSGTTGLGFDVGIEAEDGDGPYEGLLPSLVSIAWNNNRDSKLMAQFLVSTQGVAAISEASCISHKVDVSPFLTPLFHPALVEVLRIMEAQETPAKQTRAFKRFIRDYGTHYVSSAYLGAKIAHVSLFSNLERIKHGRTTLLNCSQSLATAAFGLQASPTTSDQASSNASTCFISNEVSLDQRMRTVAFGSKPDRDTKLLDWRGVKETEKAIPVRFELTPIVNLFTRELMDQRYNLSSSAILEWFLPLYLKYCKVFKFDCSLKSGCGFDDDCKLGESCVRDQEAARGFRCQGNLWADVHNWPEVPQNPTSGVDQVESRSGPANIDVASTPVDPKAEFLEPRPANLTWFRLKDFDRSGGLSLAELMAGHQSQTWYDLRFRTAVEKIIQLSDENLDQMLDVGEYLRLHELHPWYLEQVTFLVINTDGNEHLTKNELVEASLVSPDLAHLSLSTQQIENLSDGVIAVMDQNKDQRISFPEYALMCHHAFVQSFAPKNLKPLFKE